MDINRNILGRSVRKSYELTQTGVKTAYRLGKFTLETSLGAAETIGAHLPFAREHIADRLARTMPLETANQGVKAIETGMETGDEGLLRHGEAIVAAALIKADESPDVPDDVAREIAAIVEEQPIDPLSTPAISDKTADRARAIKDKLLPSD